MDGFQMFLSSEDSRFNGFRGMTLSLAPFAKETNSDRPSLQSRKALVEVNVKPLERFP